jgi:hypothetical protein
MPPIQTKTNVLGYNNDALLPKACFIISKPIINSFATKNINLLIYRMLRFLPFSLSVLFVLFLAISSIGQTVPVWNASDPIGPVFSETDKVNQRNAGTAILNAIRNASNQGVGTFTIPVGDYRFNANWNVYPVLDGLHDLNIVANGATFWFDAPQVWGIEFKNCNKVNINGLTIDYDPIPFCQGKITAINGNVARVQIMDGYTYQNASGNSVIFYKPDGSFILQGHTVATAVTPLSNNQLDVTVSLAGKSVGDYLVIPQRTGTALQVRQSSNMVFENINLWSSPGMAIYDYEGDDNVYRNIKITRRPGTNRLHCTGADGIHLASGKKGALIENCEIAYLSDDIINFHGYFGWVSRRDDARHFRVLASQNPFTIGQELDFWDRGTVKYNGKAKIVAFSKVTNQTEIDAAQVGQPTQWSNDVYDITLSADVNAQRNSLIEHHAKVCSGFTVRNSWFHDIFNRAFVLNGSPNGKIEGNTFQNIYGGLGFQMETWTAMEGQFIHGLMFQNNNLTNTAGIFVFMVPGYQGPFRTMPHTNITIQNNIISLRNGATEGIQVLGADTVSVINNTVTRNLPSSYTLPTIWENEYGFSPGTAFYFSGVKNATIKGNTVIEQGVNAGRALSLGNLTQNIILNDVTQWESIADFNTGWFINGMQGDEGWFYGALDGLKVRSGAYNPGIFNIFTAFDGTNWRGTALIPFLSKAGAHPTNSLATAKRWISTTNGNIKVNGRVVCNNGGGNGTKIYVFVNGSKRWEYNTQGQPTYEFIVDIGAVNIGAIVDFVIDSKGEDSYDNTNFMARILKEPSIIIPPLIPQLSDIYVAPGGNMVTFPGTQMGIFGDLINDARGTAATGVSGSASTGVNHFGGGNVYLFRRAVHGTGNSRIYDGSNYTAAPTAAVPYTDNYNAGGAAVRFYNLFTDNNVGTSSPSGTVVSGTGGSGEIQVEQEACITNLHTFSNGKVWTPRNAWKHAFVHYDAQAAAYTGAGASNTPFTAPATNMQIDGYAAKTGSSNFTFPIGDGVYTRFSGLSAPATGVYKVAYFAKNAPTAGTTGLSGNNALPDVASNMVASIKRVNETEFWDIDGTAASNFTLYALNSVPGYSQWAAANNFSGQTAADNIITGFDLWENLGIAPAPAAMSNDGAFTTATPTTPDPAFSAYTWANTTSAPLPVNLLTFTAAKFEESVNLTWKTANETAFSHFEIQKSVDAKEFGPVASVKGSQTSIYNYTDANPIEGINYYRLNMVDVDGSNKLSKVIALTFEKGGSYIAIENPAKNGRFTVNTNLKNPTFALLNGLGQQVPTSIASQGASKYSIEAKNPTAGIYYLTVLSNNKMSVRKILIP